MRRPLRTLFALALVAAALLVGSIPAGSPGSAALSPGAAPADDPVFAQGLQWGLEQIGAPETWARADGSGTTVAVVDSGVDLAHEDLQGQIAGEVSCIGADGDPGACRGQAQDDNGHGTHVAGIVAAATGNGRGVAGVAPGARLLAVRVLANDCTASGCTASGTAGDVTAGIRWAVAHGADVVNLSLGGGAVQAIGGCGFCDAIDEAWRAGTIVVVAAGNDSVLPSGFSDEPAVVVTATTRDDTLASYSSSSSGLLRKARWPVAAPGGEKEAKAEDCGTGGRPRGVLSTYWPGDYACLAGTSMAAPHVSGALAVLLSTGLSPQAAVDRLLATAVDLGAKGRDDSYGYGRIDLARAVTTSPPPPASSTIATPTTAPRGPAPTTSSAPPPPAGPPSTPPTTAGSLVLTPDTSKAAPFTPNRPADAEGDEPPAWLVGLAVAALAATGAATAALAWRRGAA